VCHLWPPSWPCAIPRPEAETLVAREPGSALGEIVGVRATTGLQQPSDAKLIEQSPAEPEVFAVLFDRYAADIHHYATRRLGASAADDLVAETFLAAFRRRTS
jgi:Sigma-70 region 2